MPIILSLTTTNQLLCEAPSANATRRKVNGFAFGDLPLALQEELLSQQSRLRLEEAERAERLAAANQQRQRQVYGNILHTHGASFAERVMPYINPETGRLVHTPPKPPGKAEPAPFINLDPDQIGA